MNGAAGASSTAPGGDLVKESSDRAFMADVVEASREVPVLVDFWAPWCGPCRQLTPALEKVIAEKAGKIRLVKVNIDENPSVASQLGVQSIPAVFAFAGGRPVDGFMGAIPESEVRRFADRVIAQAPGPQAQSGSMDEQIANALATGQQALANGDLNAAAEVFSLVLQHIPDNVPAALGLARVHMLAGQTEEAAGILESLPEEARKGEDYTSLVAALRLATEAAELSETDQLVAALERDPDNHQARYDLAVVLNAKGHKIEAAEALIALMHRDRAWNEEAARKKLLEFFEAWGPKEPATLKGRRMLSSLLFS